MLNVCRTPPFQSAVSFRSSFIKVGVVVFWVFFVSSCLCSSWDSLLLKMRLNFLFEWISVNANLKEQILADEGFNKFEQSLCQHCLHAFDFCKTWCRNVRISKLLSYVPLYGRIGNPCQCHWWTHSDKCITARAKTFLLPLAISVQSGYWFCLKLPHDITNGQTIYLAVPIRPD